MDSTSFKIAQRGSGWLLKCPQRRPQTAPSGHGASQGHPREAKLLPTLKGNLCCLPSRLVASDGLLKPQVGSKMAEDGPKRGPREAQDGPKSVQERPKSAPRGPQEAIFRAPRGGRKKAPLSFDRWPPRWPKRGPRGAPDGPKSAQERPKRAPKGPQETVLRGPGGDLDLDPPSF